MGKDYFKRLTEVDYTCWDLNTKWVKIRPRARHNDIVRINRKARRKDHLYLKEKLKMFSA